MSWQTLLGRALVLTVVAVAARTGEAQAVDPAAPQQSQQGNNSSKKGMTPEQRLARSLQAQLEVGDEKEWNVLVPRILKVQELNKQVKDVRDPKKAMEPRKRPKGEPADVEPYVPGYLIELAAKAADVRAAWADRAASNRDIQGRLAAFRAARAVAERQLGAELSKARESLREVLTPRQELVLVAAGVLD